jgi:hypothetical protein
MREAAWFVYAVTNTTMQNESTGFWLPYADEIDDNTTEETLDLPRNIILFQKKSVKWHKGSVWDRGYSSETPLTTRSISHSDPIHMGEPNRQVTTDEETIIVK